MNTNGWTAMRIKRLRQRSGLSQQKFAERLGISINTVAKWESGASSPHAKWSVPLLESIEKEIIEEEK